MRKEQVKAVEFICKYSDFTGDDWNGALWELYNGINTYGWKAIKLDVRQLGRNESGFYENYVNLIVPVDNADRWAKMLDVLGYGFTREEITVLKYIVEYNPDIDEVVAEIDW